MRGERVDRFTVLDHVARGSSGDVYRAEDDDHRVVALKVLDRADALEAESAALIEVDHPNVVRLVDRGTTEGAAWMALDWIEGRTLAHLLSTEGPLDSDRSQRLLRQLAEAVDAVHAAGFVHGDLSPRNMVVDLHDQLTLIDLGEVREPNTDPVDSTGALDVASTPRYAAPEVARGELPSPASDRYAVAVIAYEALTGAFPFPDVATPIAMLGHHASTPPVPPSEHRPSLALQIDDTLLAGLAKDPDRRPASAGRLIDALVGAPLAETLLVEPEPAEADELPLVADAEAGASAPAASSPPARRALIGVAALLAIVALIFVGSRLGGEEEPAVVVDSAGWPAGQAAGLVCNLLEAPGFEQDPLPDGYYSQDTTNTIALVPGAGVDGSTAIRVGSTGNYGLYAEMVPVDPGATYLLTTWVRLQGEPESSGVYANFLNADFEEITDVGGPLLEQVDEAGERIVIRSTAPDDAAWAVPTLFKDSSGGSLLVDEMLFGPDQQCPAVAS